MATDFKIVYKVALCCDTNKDGAEQQNSPGNMFIVNNFFQHIAIISKVIIGFSKCPIFMAAIYVVRKMQRSSF